MADTQGMGAPQADGISQAEPEEVSALDPSRNGLEYLARAVWLAGTTLRDKEAIWETLSAGDRWPYFRSAIAVVEALHELGRRVETERLDAQHESAVAESETPKGVEHDQHS